MLLRHVLVEIVEQFNSFKGYFLGKILSKKGFKFSVVTTKRYHKIKQCLKNKNIVVIMSPVTYFAQDFKRFSVPLQGNL